jgi:hypothetical protein
MGLMSGVLGTHGHARGLRATGHVAALEPSHTKRRVWSHRTRGNTGALWAVVLVPRSHCNARAFLCMGWAWSHEARGDSGDLSCRVTGSVPRGMWQHWSPFMAGGMHGASGHMTTLEPFPGRWRALCHGHVATPESSSGGWRALCLGTCGRARALWNREQIWGRGTNFLSLVHRGTQSAEYRHESYIRDHPPLTLRNVDDSPPGEMSEL